MAHHLHGVVRKLSSTARSLLQLSQQGAKVTELLLPCSPDLVCNNLFCDKVGMACLCRLERALQKANPMQLKRIDLSGNRLEELPPFIYTLKDLEELDISKNNFSIPPQKLQLLSKLQKIKLENNPCGK